MRAPTRPHPFPFTFPFLSLVLASTLMACGGGGDDDGGPPGGDGGNPPPGSGSVALSGTIHAAGGQLADSDTADENAPSTPNDTPSTAQPVPSAVTLGGHADEEADPVDAFRGSFAAGQIVTLTIADPDEGDLDLYLYTSADPTAPVDLSEGEGGTETVTVPEGGEYDIVVLVYSGATNYVMTVGTGGPVLGSAGALRLTSDFVPGEVIVQFDDAAIGPAGGASDHLAARAASLGLVPLAGAVRGRPALLGLGGTAPARAAALATLGAAARAPGGYGAPSDPDAAARHDTLLAVKALRRRADVRTAELNYIHRTLRVPSDEFFSFQWHYPLINLPQAWDITTGTPATGNVVVAVIDTGVFLAHPDMNGQLVAGFDFISTASRARDGDGIDANPDDPGDGAQAGESSWHGTHVSGTVAARTDDGQGVAGVSWGAKVMPVRVLGAGGGTTYDIIQGVRFAAGLSNDSGTVPPRRADIANLSLGCQDCFDQAEQDTFTAARNAGMIVVAAAGNANTSVPGYPASYDGVVSVSAVDLNGDRAPYSNFGPGVDIAAPGGDTSRDLNGDGFADGVLSSLVDDSGGTRTPTWVFYQGTSMASPHVAGVVALMKAVCPSLTPAQLDALIESGQMTTDLGSPGRDDTFGHGLIDALAAVQSAQTQCGAAPATGLDVFPARLDFGASATSFSLTASRQGDGALSIVDVAADEPWLTVTAGAVDADGLGPYTATVSRDGLADGRYSATIRFSLAGGGGVTVPVSMELGAKSGAGDAGYLYVLLIDSNQETVAQLGGRGTAGNYQFAFSEVPSGQYYLVAGTDSDGDDLICDAGEACGGWPTLGVPTAVSVDAEDVTGLDFVTGFEVTLGQDIASTHAPRAGYRLLTGPETFGGGRQAPPR